MCFRSLRNSTFSRRLVLGRNRSRGSTSTVCLTPKTGWATPRRDLPLASTEWWTSYTRTMHQYRYFTQTTVEISSSALLFIQLSHCQHKLGFHSSIRNSYPHQQNKNFFFFYFKTKMSINKLDDKPSYRH